MCFHHYKLLFFTVHYLVQITAMFHAILVVRECVMSRQIVFLGKKKKGKVKQSLFTFCFAFYGPDCCNVPCHVGRGEHVMSRQITLGITPDKGGCPNSSCQKPFTYNSIIFHHYRHSPAAQSRKYFTIADDMDSGL